MSKKTKGFPLEASVDRLIVIRDPDEEKTKGGIYLPDNAKKKTKMATVLAVGEPGVTSGGQPMPILPWQTGDRVYINEYVGNILEVGADEYDHDEKQTILVIHRDDVLATMR
jgi:chaperonin GroES